MDPVEPWIDGNAVRRLAAQLLSSPSGSEIADSPDAGFGPGFEGFTSGESKPDPQPGEPVEASNAAAVATETPTPPTEASAPPIEASAPPIESPAPPRVEPVHQGFKDSVAEPPQSAPVEAGEALKNEEPAAKPFLAAVSEAPSATQDDQSKPSLESEDSDHPFQNISKPAASAGVDSKRGPLMDRMLRFREWLNKHAKARSVFVLDREGQPVLDDPAYSKLHFLARSLSQAYRPVPGQPGNVHVKVGSDAYLVVIPVETDFGCLVLGTVLPRPLSAPSVEIVAKVLVDASKPRRS